MQRLPIPSDLHSQNLRAPIRALQGMEPAQLGSPEALSHAESLLDFFRRVFEFRRVIFGGPAGPSPAKAAGLQLEQAAFGELEAGLDDPAARSLVIGVLLYLGDEFVQWEKKGPLFSDVLPFFDPPPLENIPRIRGHLAARLGAASAILNRLEKVTTWGNPQRGSLPDEVRTLLDQIDSSQTGHQRLTSSLELLSPGNVPYLSKRISALYIQVHNLQKTVSSHSILRSVLKSEMVEIGWAMEPPSIPDEEASYPGLGDFFRDTGVLPQDQTRIAYLLRLYEAYLRAKKGGEPGLLQDQPFDPEAFAVATAGGFKGEEVEVALRFMKGKWGQAVCSLADLEGISKEIGGRVLREKALQGPLFPTESLIRMTPSAETMGQYLRPFHPDRWNREDFKKAVGVYPEAALQWGMGRRKRPRDIGSVISFFSFVIEDSWMRAVMHGRLGDAVLVPDLTEILRLSGGESAEPFFQSTKADSKEVIVYLPEAVLHLDFSSMIYHIVLDEIFNYYSLRTDRVAEGIRGIFAQAIGSRTLQRHRQGLIMAHRRIGRSRETERRLMSRIIGPERGPVTDFFFEARPVIRRVCEVILPDGRVIQPDWPVRSPWRVRLVPAVATNAPLMEGSGRIDREIYPYKYLTGDRSAFTTLLYDLRARLVFLRDIRRIDRSREFQAGSGTLADALKELESFERRHQRLLIRLNEYLKAPARTPLSTPETYERFYLRLLLFARAVRETTERMGGNETVMGISVNYILGSPGVEGLQSPSLSLTGKGGVWEARMLPDPLVSLAIGEKLSAEGQKDLFRLRLLVSCLRAEGVILEEEVPRVASRLFAERSEEDVIRLAGFLRKLEWLEREVPGEPALDASNPDVRVIYHRIDSLLSRRDRPSGKGDPKRGLEDSLRDYFYARHGMPPKNLPDHVAAIERYFALHPGFKTAFREDLLRRALSESVAVEGVRERMWEDLLEFLAVTGIPSREVHRPVAFPARDPLPPRPAAPAPPNFPDVPMIPSRQGVMLDDFLDSKPVTSLRNFLVLAIPHIEEAIRSGAKTTTALEGRLRSLAEGRSRLLGGEGGEPSVLFQGALSFFAYLKNRVQWARDLVAGSLPPSVRLVAREVSSQVILRGAVENLAVMTERVLRESGKFRDYSPETRIFKDTLQGVQESLAVMTAQVHTIDKDLMGVFELFKADGSIRTRDSLFTALRDYGRDLAGERFEGLQDLQQWEDLLERHALHMALFHPDRRHEVRQGWDRLCAALPSTSSLSVPIESRPGAAGRDHETPPALPPRRWDPAPFTHLYPLETHRAVWGEALNLLEGGGGGEREDMVIYEKEGGLRVTRISEKTMADINRMKSNIGTGRFSFRDEATGHTVDLIAFQIRMAFTVRIGDRKNLGWLSRLDEADPQASDVLALCCFSICLRLAETLHFSDPARTDFRRIQDGFFRRGPRSVIREDMNRFVPKYERELLRGRNRFSNLGYSYLSAGTTWSLSAYLTKKQKRASKVHHEARRMLDLLDTHPGLSPEVRRMAGDAITNLEGKYPRQDPDYEDFLQGLAGAFEIAWPNVRPREVERLQALMPGDDPLFRLAPAKPDASAQTRGRIPMAPSGRQTRPSPPTSGGVPRRTPIGVTSPQNAEKLQAENLFHLEPAENLRGLAEAPELLRVTVHDMRALQRKLKERCEMEERRGGREKSEIVTFYKRVMKILQCEDLEPLHRILFVLLDEPFFAPLLLRANLVFFVNSSPPGWDRRPQGRGEMSRVLLSFYLRYRGDLLWRLWETGGDRSHAWVEGELGVPQGKRYRLSAEFPELEEVTFGEIDRAYQFLQWLREGENAFVVTVQSNGLREFVLVPRDLLLTRHIPDLRANVTIGIRSGSKTISFRRPLSSHPVMGDIFRDLPAGDQEIVIEDIFGRQVILREPDIISSFEAKSFREEPGLRSLSGLCLRMLSDYRLRDLHPIAVMLHNLHTRAGIPLATPKHPALPAQGGIDELFTDVESTTTWALEAYRQLRGQFKNAGVGGRFERYFR